MKEKIKSLMRQLIESEERAQAAELHSSELALQLSAVPTNKPPPPSGAPPEVVAALNAQIADLRAQNDSLQNAVRSAPAAAPDLSAELAAEQRLRADAETARAAAETARAAADRRVAAAEQRATAAEQKAHSLEQRLAGADQRAAAGASSDAKLAAAEQRAAAAEQRAATAEQRATSAEQRASSADQRIASADQRATAAEQKAAAADHRAAAAEKRAASAAAATSVVHEIAAAPPLSASPRAAAPVPAARRGPPPATPTRAMPPTAPPRHVTSSGDDAVSPRQPPPPSPPASDDVASPREQPPPPSEAPESEADTATSAPPMRGPPPIQPRAPPSGGGGGPPSSAPPSRPPPSAPLPGGSMTMRRGPPPAVPSAGGGEFSSMTMPRQRSTTDSPAPASRSSAALSPPTLLAASPGGGGPPPVAPRKGSGAAMLGSSVAVQSVPVRRDIPAIEISKGGKNDLQGGWAVVGDQNVAKKKYMEDAFVMLPDFMPNAAYFAVYDGHEGREAVDYVRTKLHEHLRDSLNEGKTVFEAFEASYRRCDADLCALEVRKSGTTAVSVLIRKEGKNRVLYVANVGDSRATLCNKGKGERLSYDHKASDPAENKRVTDLGATVLWDKVQGQLSVTRALGDHDLKQYVSCEPHFATMTLAKEHKFLVVACDGIWDVTDDQTAVDVLEKAGKEPVAKAKRLIEYVIEKGTTDNLTAAFINLQV